MDKVYLPINFVNMISVVLMFALGMTLVGLVVAGLQGVQSANAE